MENHPWRLAAVGFVTTSAVSLGILILVLDQTVAFAAAYSIAFATVFSVTTGIANSLRSRRNR
jgi:hypothetical protein